MSNTSDPAPSAAGRFVARLATAGIAITIDGGRVRVEPAAALTGHDRRLVGKYRQALLRHLASAPAGDLGCVVCGTPTGLQAPSGRRYCPDCHTDYLQPGRHGRPL